MGVKKKKEESTKLVSKILIVCVCVLFVGLMILAGMGTSWLSMFKSIKTGDTVVLDYTIYNSAGNPVLTTDQQIFTQNSAKNISVLGSKQIKITANQTLSGDIYPVPVYIPNSGSLQQFALFAPEYNEMSRGLVGMKVNEHKRIITPFNQEMKRFMSADELAAGKVNVSTIALGDIFFLGVSSIPKGTVPNATSVNYVRSGIVIDKTDDGIIIDLGYPSIDLHVVSINTER